MKNSCLTLLIILLMLASCNSKQYYADDQRVDENGWHLNDKLYFNVEVDDTTAIYNFIINIRNTAHYPYSNTFLFINTTFPDGGIAHDTLECPLADVDGRWYGKRTGHYIDNSYYFRKHVVFPQKGRYSFEISHGMRDTAVVGIKNIGLHIEHI